MLEHYSPFDNIILYTAIHKAKEMEKEQIEQAYFDGTEFETNGFECNPNRYYNETFKQ